MDSSLPLTVVVRIRRRTVRLARVEILSPSWNERRGRNAIETIMVIEKHQASSNRKVKPGKGSHM
eukprot:scaffold5220_cov188-Amphora_coffeaeformis.AAC.5